MLLAIVDADYKFIYADIGCNGRISDGGVFRNCNLYRALEEKRLNIPNPTKLPGTQSLFSYVIVADDAFPLKDYILKPYSQSGLTQERRIFNYRLSRARRIVENAFGILSNRFRIFMTPIGLVPETVETYNGMLHTTQFSTFKSRITFYLYATWKYRYKRRRYAYCSTRRMAPRASINWINTTSTARKQSSLKFS